MPRLRPRSVAEVLANNRGHIPKHAKVYRNFAAKYDRLQRERLPLSANSIAMCRARPSPKRYRS